MEENTNSVPTPETAAQKPDWVASVLTGTLKHPQQLIYENVKANSFDFKPADTYWAKEGVKAKFNNDRAAFDEFYNNQRKDYDKTVAQDAQYENFAVTDFGSRLAKSMGRPMVNISHTYDKFTDPEGRPIFGSMAGQPKWTLRGKANEVGVKVGDKYVPVDEYEGNTRYARNDDGSWKFNEKGTSYLEPYDSEKDGDWRTFDEEYSAFADKAGIYGLKTTFTPADILYFPAKNTMNFLTNTVADLSEYARVGSEIADLVGAFTTGDENYESFVTKGLKDFQASARSSRLPSSEDQMKNPWGMMNLAEMGVQAGLQLASMGGVARLAAVLSKSEKTASLASRLYMTGMAAGHVAQIAREKDLSPIETGLLLGATSIPYFYISQLSEEAMGLARQFGIEKNMPKILSDTYGKTIGNKAFNWATVTSYKDSVKASVANIGSLLQSSPVKKSIVFESGEEVLEEVSENSMYELYDRLKGADVFNIDWGKVWTENIPLSAVGGGIGGAIGHRVLKAFGQVHPEAVNSLEDLAVTGEMWRFYDLIDKYQKEGRLGDTIEANASQAAFYKEIAKSLETIWEESGLKKAIHNNELLAKQSGYLDILKATKIGQDLKDQTRKLTLAQNKLSDLTVRSSKEGLSPEAVQDLNNQILNAQKEISAIEGENKLINNGSRFDRYVTEGLYNIAMKTDRGKTIAMMNEESKLAKTRLAEEVAAYQKQLEDNDNIIGLDNLETVAVTDKGVQNLHAKTIQSAKDFVNSLPDTIKSELKTISEATGLPLDDIIDQVTSGTTLDEVTFGLYGMYEDITNSGVKVSPELGEVLSKMNSQADFITKKVMTKRSNVADNLGPDRGMLSYFDEKLGRTTLPFEAMISSEELLQTTREGKENEMYISDVPEQIIKGISARLNQLQTVEMFKDSKHFIKPAVENPEYTSKELTKYLVRAAVLDQKSKQNSGNTEVAVKKIYLKKGDVLMAELGDYVLPQIAKSQIFGDKFEDVKNAIIEKMTAVRTAIMNQDVPSYNTAIRDLEVELYNQFKPKRNEILTSIQYNYKSQLDKYSEEGQKKKYIYDYLRGITIEDPVVFYRLYSSALKKMEQSGNAPTFEHRQTILDSLRNLVAGDYAWKPMGHDPSSPRASNYHFSVGIDGASGTGKTSTIIPMIAYMANEYFSTVGNSKKVVLTAAHDDANQRKVNLIKAIERFSGKKPDWIVQGDSDLLDLVRKADDDTSLIIYDEATLIPKATLDEIHKELDAINSKRRKEGVVHLHIVYTYDRFQNSAKIGNNAQHSINSLNVNIPTSQRLTFSFRSQNRELKLVEEYIRENHSSKGNNLDKLVLTHKNYEGVQIFNDKAKFEKAASELMAKMSKDNKAGSVKYITTNSSVAPVANPVSFNINPIDSYNSQGIEWDYVILDDTDGKIFSNSVKASEYYTGATRARKGLLMFTSVDIPMESVSGEVQEFTPLRPASISRDADISELDNYLQKFESSPVPSTYSYNGNSSQKPLPKPSKAPEETQTSQSAFIPTPMGDVKDEDREEIASLILKGLPPETTIHLNTFFTPAGTNLKLKQDMIYDDKTIDLTNYYLTVAKVGSPGYDNTVNNDENYQGEWAVFIEGYKGNERAVIGTLKDMNQYIRKGGLQKYMVDDKISIPISNQFIRNSYDHHPWIENTNKDKVNLAKERTLDYLRKDSHGLTTSSVLIATNEIVGYNPESKSPKIPNGTPFVVLSYSHTSTESLDKDLRDGKVKVVTPNRKLDSNFQAIALYRPKNVIPADDVYNMMKKYVKPFNGRLNLMVSDTEADGIDFGYVKLRDSFWARPKSDKKLKKQDKIESSEPGDRLYTPTYSSDYEKLYESILAKVGADPNVKKFMETGRIIQSNDASKPNNPVEYSRYDISRLMDMYVLLRYQRENPTGPQPINPDVADAIDKMMMVANTFLGGGFKFDTSMAAKSIPQGAPFGFAQKLPKNLYNTMLKTSYWRLSPPVLKVDKRKIEKYLSNIKSVQNERTDVIEQGVDNESGEQLTGLVNNIRKISPTQFIQAEFKDDEQRGLKALRQFRGDIMGSMLVLEGTEPRLVDINDAISTLRSEYNKPVNTDKRKLAPNSDIAGALNRHFDGLLAHYFPAVAYDAASKKYYLKTGNKKSGLFSEKEESYFFDDGMNDIVKSFIYNTPMMKWQGTKENRTPVVDKLKDGTTFFMGKRHLQKVLPLLKGAVSTQDVQSRLRAKINSSPEALTVYTRFFSPEAMGKFNSLYNVNSTSAMNLLTAIEVFLKSEAEYIPGFSQHTLSSYKVGDDLRVSSSRVGKFVLSGFKPSTVEASYMSELSLNMGKLHAAKSLRTDKNNIFWGDEVYPKDKTALTDNQMLKLVNKIIPGFTNENLESLFKNDPQSINSPETYKKQLLDYFNKSINQFPSIEPDSFSDRIITDIFDEYINSAGLGGNHTYIGADGRRQYSLRQTSPIMLLPEEVERIRKDYPDSVLSNNLLVKEGSNYSVSKVIDPINHQGVKSYLNGRKFTKSLADMDGRELLEMYLLEGFVSPVSSGKGSGRAFFPVTVYSDANSEILPVIESQNWLRSEDAIMDDVFDSRVAYYTRIQRNILNAYSKELGISAKDINELGEKLLITRIPVSTAEASTEMIANLYYKSSGGNVSLNPSLVADINRYVLGDNLLLRKKFKEDIKAETDSFAKYSTSDSSFNSSKRTLIEQVREIVGNENNESLEYVRKFYLNWLAVKDSFEQVYLGSRHQYKGDTNKQMTEMVKRAKLAISPGMLYVYRDTDYWEKQVSDFRTQNPGKNLPLRLKHEGKKLNPNSRIAVIEEIEELVRELNTGAKTKQKVNDGATFVSPFTRLMQRYSSGGNYGFTVDAVMKNATKSMDYNTAVNRVVKNAEFAITPELLQVGTDAMRTLHKNFFTVPFEVPVDGMNSAYDFLRSYGLSEDLSDIKEADYERLLDDLVERGLQDYVIQEMIPPSSLKTGVSGINKINQEFYKTQSLDIHNKVMQQDAIKDPSKGLDTKVLTQLVQAVSINWKNPAALENFYNTLSEITRMEMSKFDAMDPKEIDDLVKSLISKDVIAKDEVNYRTEAVALGLISKNDRLMSSLFTEKLSSHIKNTAVAYALRGGHYIVHPTNGWIKVYDVTTKEGVNKTLLRNQIPEGATVNQERDLRYVDAVRMSDKKTLTQLYDEAGNNPDEIAKIHKSLQEEEWITGEAEIILPSEMAKEFMLEDALASGLTIDDIDKNYFYKTLTKNLDKIDDSTRTKYSNISVMMQESFKKRLGGIIARIPTSGKHSAMSTRIVGFINNSKNSLFAPAEMLKIQGADQDIDKGSYLTYKTIQKYIFKHPGTSETKSSYNINAFPGYDIISTSPTGVVITSEDEMKSFLENFDVPAKDKPAIRRVMLENKLVSNLKEILGDSKNIVEMNTSVEAVMKEFEELMKKIDASANYKHDDIRTLTEIHRLNQAGGKNLTGIFANGFKAYAVTYIASKLSGVDVNLAGVSNELNLIWERYAAMINATVDNANLGYLGPNGIDNITAPYVAYWISQGQDINQLRESIQNPKYQPLFEAHRKANIYDKVRGFNPDNLSGELKGLYYRAQEFSLMGRLYVNRDLPVDPKEIIQFVESINKEVRGRTKMDTFSITDFLSSEEHASEAIEKYDASILKTPEGIIDENSQSNYNILKILNAAPHIKEYVRSLIKVHEYSMTQKVYKSTFNLYSAISAESFPDATLYDSVEDFVHTAYIQQYLNSRDFSSLTRKDLTTPQGRQDFIKDNIEGLLGFRAANNGNLFANDLRVRNRYEDGEETPYQWIGVSDFYQMNEDMKTSLVYSFKRLPEDDKKRLFLMNLIVTRDKNASGSLASFISPAVKRNWIEFMDYEAAINEKTLLEDYRANKVMENEDVEMRSKSLYMPYNINVVSNQQYMNSRLNMYDYAKDSPIKVVEYAHIRSKSIDNVSNTNMTLDGVSYIAISPKQIQLDFNDKAWQRTVKHMDGTKSKGLQDGYFTSVANYKKFLIDLEFNKLNIKNDKKNYISDAQYYDDMVSRALKTSVGKELTKRPSEKQYREDAIKCGLKLN